MRKFLPASIHETNEGWLESVLYLPSHASAHNSYLSILITRDKKSQ